MEEQTYNYKTTDRFVSVDPSKQLIIVHFGKATQNEEESTALAEWFQTTLQDIFSEYPTINFFLIADGTHLDDSTLPSDRAREVYGEILGETHINQLVLITLSFGMRMILDVIGHLSKKKAKTDAVKDMDAAMKLYSKWLEKQQG